MTANTEKHAKEYLGTFSSERGEPDPTFDTGGRPTLAIEKRVDGEHRIPADPADADVVSSDLGNDMHAPCIDIDIPIRVIPSTTPGHGHLYIDMPVTWDHYLDILHALAAARIVEPGYVMASECRKATHVRLPWVKKVPEEVPLP